MNKLFKRTLMAIIVENSKDWGLILDIAGNYTKVYRSGLINGDDEKKLITLYISKNKFKKLEKRLKVSKRVLYRKNEDIDYVYYVTLED